ncbi:hypothetical protein [Nocardia arthritidis]|uniref:Uncharacterized protein n=1 Tax=Nocardia arthritidis TaxID=228602 RepID=A0A6G9Y6B7_9NOCA|nr:hypothetical protein [Nocardia arthritidis]QIS08593.1 hypothetical protein F5544_03395 [Nocardia arthritidis]
MSGADGMIGDEPLADGMEISLRYRLDLRVTDARRLLAAARRAYLELNPDATAAEAQGEVRCAAEAIGEILAHAGLFGDGEVHRRLESRVDDGVEVGGWAARICVDEPYPLSPSPLGNCLRGDEIFEVPARDGDDGLDGRPDLV